MLIIIMLSHMIVLLPHRAEFGGILFYFYICDRTSVLGESKKVPPLSFFDEFPFLSFNRSSNIPIPFMC